MGLTPAFRLEPRAARRLQRALRQPRSRGAGVVVARRDVVRPTRIEERRERLNLPPADIELELAAAVETDAVCIAVLDALEQPFDGAEARRLDVHPTGLDRERADVVDRMDRGVKAEARLLAA